MGIYIKGMKMPEEGSWATIRIYPDGTCAVPNWQGDCTLIRGAQAVSVPPHGDLISRETAKLYHSYLVDERTDIRVPAIPLSVLNVIPTIIPAEPAEEGET